MKTVWVLSGGGAKGIFQLGMIKAALEEYGWPDVVIGTSVGSMNGALVASKQIKELTDIWYSIEKKSDVFKRRFLSYGLFWKKNSIYTFKPLKSLVEKHLDTKKLAESNIEFFPCCVDFNNGKAIIFNKRSPFINEAILASSSIPVLFEPMHGLYDGGVRQVVPLKWAFDHEPDRIIVLLAGKYEIHSSNRNWDKANTINVFVRTIDVATNQIAKANVELMLERNRNPKYQAVESIICEPDRLTLGTLDFGATEYNFKQAEEIGYTSFKNNRKIYNKDNNWEII